MTYTKEYLIEEVKRVSTEYCDGGVPRLKDINKHGDVSEEPYYRFWDSWADVLNEIGFEQNREISEEELIVEIDRVSEKYCDGKAPRQKDMDEYSKYSSGTYSNRFGSWVELLEENGYKANTRSKEYSKQDLINEIKRVNEICEGTPTQRNMIDFGSISIPTFNDRFGGWNSALKKAGFEINHEKNITSENLLDEIKRVSQEYCGDEVPSCNQMRKHGKYSILLYFNTFGSWKNALEEIEMEIDLREYTNQELLDDLVELSEKHCDGNPPQIKDVIKYTPHSNTIYLNRFGGLKNALEKAGIPKEKITKEDLINEINRISSEYDCRPTQKLMTNEGEYAVNTYHRRFGSWDNGLVEAGFESFEYPSGEDHPTWKGGTERYYGPTWYSKRNEAIERDDYKCRLCNSTEEECFIDVHHITPVRYWDIENEHRMMNALHNLISVCRSCHNKYEGKFKGRSHEDFEVGIKENLL